MGAPQPGLQSGGEADGITGSCSSAHTQRVAQLTRDKRPCSGNQRHFQTQGFGLVDVHHLALVPHLQGKEKGAAVDVGMGISHFWVRPVVGTRVPNLRAEDLGIRGLFWRCWS